MTGACQAADGALAAVAAVYGLARGAGPTLVLAFPPTGNQVAAVLEPPDVPPT